MVVYNALQHCIDEFRIEVLNESYDPVTIIHGAARGADTIADICAQLLGYEIERYPANWDEHGRAAGPIRNQEMLDTGIDLCIAFHYDLSNSKGTANMIRRCERAGIPVYKVEEPFG